MATTTITVQHPRAGDYKGLASMRTRTVVQRVVAFIDGVVSGNFGSGVTTMQVGQTPATGTLTLSGGAGAVGGTINGVAVTATWATSDTVSAGLIAAAINASANVLVNQHVSATSAGAVVTLTAKCAGPAGNAITLVASGTGVTASAARLAGGAATTYTF